MACVAMADTAMAYTVTADVVTARTVVAYNGCGMYSYGHHCLRAITKIFLGP